jgi:hypothetical protein
MNLKEVGMGDKDWITLAQGGDRWYALKECGNEPLGSIECGRFLTG